MLASPNMFHSGGGDLLHGYGFQDARHGDPLNYSINPLQAGNHFSYGANLDNHSVLDGLHHDPLDGAHTGTNHGQDNGDDEGSGEDDDDELSRGSKRSRSKKPHLQGRFSGRLATKDDEKRLADECKLLGPLLGGVGKRGDKSRLTLAKIVRGIATGDIRRYCMDRENGLHVLRTRLAQWEQNPAQLNTLRAENAALRAEVQRLRHYQSLQLPTDLLQQPGMPLLQSHNPTLNQQLQQALQQQDAQRHLLLQQQQQRLHMQKQHQADQLFNTDLQRHQSASHGGGPGRSGAANRVIKQDSHGSSGDEERGEDGGKEREEGGDGARGATAGAGGASTSGRDIRDGGEHHGPGGSGSGIASGAGAVTGSMSKGGDSRRPNKKATLGGGLLNASNTLSGFTGGAAGGGPLSLSNAPLLGYGGLLPIPSAGTHQAQADALGQYQQQVQLEISTIQSQVEQLQTMQSRVEILSRQNPGGAPRFNNGVGGPNTTSNNNGRQIEAGLNSEALQTVLARAAMGAQRGGPDGRLGRTSVEADTDVGSYRPSGTGANPAALLQQLQQQRGMAGQGAGGRSQDGGPGGDHLLGGGYEQMGGMDVDNYLGANAEQQGGRYGGHHPQR